MATGKFLKNPNIEGWSNFWVNRATITANGWSEEAIKIFFVGRDIEDIQASIFGRKTISSWGTSSIGRARMQKSYIKVKAANAIFVS